MRPGLEADEFFLLYQPQVDLRSGELVGAEALIRWRHVELGIVSPAEFIPISEANGFVTELGNWALLQACREAAQWPDHLTVAVNVSPLQFSDSDLIATVRSALAQTGLKPSRLHLEITESAFMEGSDALVSIVRQLREMDITIALDDFGTGYSSLSYIAGFPLDKLKIDQSFVRKIATEPQSMIIVQAVKSLAGGLGLTVVAEGIETETERSMLASIGCEQGQGYFFGKPQTASELLRSLQNPQWKAA